MPGGRIIYLRANILAYQLWLFPMKNSYAQKLINGLSYGMINKKSGS